MPYWLQAAISFASIIILLRISGKRTLGQMTPEEVVIMLALGTLLVHPLKSQNTWISIYGGALLTLGIIIVYFVEYHFPRTKSWIMGEPLILIKDGEIIKINLRKARMTEDELIMRLRVRSVEDISIIEIAILEISGDLSIMLKEQYENVTKKDIEDIKRTMDLICRELNICKHCSSKDCKVKENLFIEVEEIQYKDPLQ